jgi:hypothetical protein
MRVRGCVGVKAGSNVRQRTAALVQAANGRAALLLSGSLVVVSTKKRRVPDLFPGWAGASDEFTRVREC